MAEKQRTKAQSYISICTLRYITIKIGFLKNTTSLRHYAEYSSGMPEDVKQSIIYFYFFLKLFTDVVILPNSCQSAMYEHVPEKKLNVCIYKF